MVTLKLLSALLPILMGIAVIIGMQKYSDWKHSPRGVSPSYFASVALLFALFLSLVFSEVWNKVSKTNALMTEQANSMRALLRMTEPLGPDSIRVANAVKNYIQKLKEQEVNDDMLGGSGYTNYKVQSFSKKTFTLPDIQECNRHFIPNLKTYGNPGLNGVNCENNIYMQLKLLCYSSSDYSPRLPLPFLI